MVKFTHVLTLEDGLHARPAGLLVKAAQGYTQKIIVSKGDKKADAKRLFSVLSLRAVQGDQVTIYVDGDDARDAAIKLRDFFRSSL
ncbi:MAG: HPr family phosphocarrier protein [Treponema sp.]|nr:HPr family phosphocarrier protein [Treponema sp.]